MDRVGQYAKVGETTLFEIRVEMNMQFRSYFQPRVPDDLKVIHVTTQFPDKAHADSGTPQLEREYDIETGTLKRTASAPPLTEKEIAPCPCRSTQFPPTGGCRYIGSKSIQAWQAIRARG